MPESIPERAELLTAVVRVPDYVVARSFADETVVLNLNTSQYHSLNGTGGRMLEVLGETPSVPDAAARLKDEFDAPTERIQEDLADFCRSLIERDLLILA
jgi:Coenzyme PQQ synthesis protein D (PqqD)